METSECIFTRRSVRKFLSTPIGMDKIGEILKAGKSAPSAGNVQDWRFILVTDQAKRNQIAEACLNQHWIANAPVHIVVCALYEKNKKFYGERGERLYSIQDSAAAVQNMLLMAHNLGLGACWVGAFEEQMLAEVLNIAPFARPQAVIPIGYADEKPPVPIKDTIEVVTFIERFGRRYKSIDHFMTKWGPGNREKVEKARGFLEDKKKKVLRRIRSIGRKEE